MIEHIRVVRRRHDNQTTEGIEHTVLQLRQAHVRLGPKKLKWVL